MQPRLRKLAVDGEGKLAVEVGERRIGEGKFGEGGGCLLAEMGGEGSRFISCPFLHPRPPFRFPTMVYH